MIQHFSPKAPKLSGMNSWPSRAHALPDTLFSIFERHERLRFEMDFIDSKKEVKFQIEYDQV
jgi:hypothetical protein